MKTNEKLTIMKTNEKLECVIRELGMTPQDVVQNFVSQKKLDSKFLEEIAKKAKSFENVNIFPSKKYVTPKNIRAGMFEYQSGLISPKRIPKEQLRGIVGYADNKEILVWCLRSKKLCWSDEVWDAGTEDKQLWGWEATQKVLETANKLGKNAPAAQWCVSYDLDGVEIGSAFLPSYFDYELLIPNMKVVKVVKDIFREIGLDFGDVLWSSSEYSYNSAWFSYFSNTNGLDWNGKRSNYNLYVRPVRRILR